MSIPNVTPAIAEPLREPLTPRQTEVFLLICRGVRSRDAAKEIFVSKRTIDFHLSEVYRKLGVKSRFGAFLRARALGLLP